VVIGESPFVSVGPARPSGRRTRETAGGPVRGPRGGAGGERRVDAQGTAPTIPDLADVGVERPGGEPLAVGVGREQVVAHDEREAPGRTGPVLGEVERQAQRGTAWVPTSDRQFVGA